MPRPGTSLRVHRWDKAPKLANSYSWQLDEFEGDEFAVSMTGELYRLLPVSDYEVTVYSSGVAEWIAMDYRLTLIIEEPKPRDENPRAPCSRTARSTCSRSGTGRLSRTGLSFRFGLSMRSLHLYIYTGGGSSLMQARLFYRLLRLALPSSFWGDTNQGTQVLAYLM